ncbi:nitrogenase molybdenum-iron protein beta chain [Methanococcus voltae PS]|uniref:Nitrogenase molybdenum-iron protein beta chain n=1 Tax=Methanococcus voltae PS TaxID=523842 RepID=A0ABT2EXQ1_METVO|nr:nitrogenase component 1 [Methanococcus voltae]MCS3922743.1 nitrogenase molybdenum-iron protein beta chain [Methanococcus voltae PS]
MDAGKYFGTFRACYGIKNAIILNHAPVGCNWGTMIYGTSQNLNDLRMSSSIMHEQEIVFGGENTLKETLISMDTNYDTVKNPLLVLLVGDIPSIIGDDVSGIVDDVEIEKDYVIINAEAFKGDAEKGYEDGLLRLYSLISKNFDKKTNVEKDTNINSINLIGVSIDDYKIEADLKEIKRILKEFNIDINCVISNCTYSEFLNTPNADLNVVMGQGFEFAKIMQKEHNIDYVSVNYPYGIEGTKKFVKSIISKLENNIYKDEEAFELKYNSLVDYEPYKRASVYMNGLYSVPVSIIGDFKAESMAEFLSQELGMDIEVVAHFGEDYKTDVLSSYTTMIFGSSFEKGLSNDLDIPLIRYTYPVFDNVSLSDNIPYAGINGALCLVEDILNSALSRCGKFKYNI